MLRGRFGSRIKILGHSLGRPAWFFAILLFRSDLGPQIVFFENLVADMVAKSMFWHVFGPKTGQIIPECCEAVWPWNQDFVASVAAIDMVSEIYPFRMILGVRVGKKVGDQLLCGT